MYINQEKWRFVNKLKKIFLVLVLVFSLTTLIIQIKNSYSFYDVETSKRISQMSGKIHFFNTKNCVCIFSESTACLNVYNNDKLLYSAKIPKDPKENYHIYGSDFSFSIGTGCDYNGNNTLMYKFNQYGYIEQLDYNGAIPQECQKLEVNNYTYTSDMWGNVYIDNINTGTHYKIETSLYTVYMNDPIYPLILFAISSFLLIVPLIIKIIKEINIGS